MNDVLQIQSGASAFGDGSHPTTAGVLAALEAIDPTLFTPLNACDIGCGSGILAMAIARLFGCPVMASDISAPAIDVMRDSVIQNGLAEYITVVQAPGFAHPVIQSEAPYALIVMNILAEPLLALAADANAHLAPEGVLIISGLLQWQEQQIRDAYQSLGLELTTRLCAGDWVTLVWQKPT